MPYITKGAFCSNCGAPLQYEEKEAVITCKYCGATQMLDVSKPFILDHSSLALKYHEDKVNDVLLDWMREGFMKPKDLAKKSVIVSSELTYLPFWIVSVTVNTSYEGIFERVSPPVRKKDSFRREYDWRIIGRRGSDFPTKEFDIPLSRRVPFDFLKIPPRSIILNSEIDGEEAKSFAKQQIEEHHKFLISSNVDRIIDFKIDFIFNELVYLHAPLWFIRYKYKGELFDAIIDANSGKIVKGEFPV